MVVTGQNQTLVAPIHKAIFQIQNKIVTRVVEAFNILIHPLQDKRINLFLMKVYRPYLTMIDINQIIAMIDNITQVSKLCKFRSLKESYSWKN